MNKFVDPLGHFLLICQPSRQISFLQKKVNQFEKKFFSDRFFFHSDDIDLN